MTDIAGLRSQIKDLRGNLDGPTRTAAKASEDFIRVRGLRNLADDLKESGQITEQQWRQAQQRLAGLDRAFFAEEEVTRNPLNAAVMLFGIPADQMLKMINATGGRSKATFSTLSDSFRGLNRGVKNVFSGKAGLGD